MKKILTIVLIFALASCTATRQGAETKNMTVTHVEKTGPKTEVYATTGRYVWRAEFDYLPDSVKVGTILMADRSTKDTCTCIFKRIK